MATLTERLRPKTPSGWVMAVGFIGSLGFTGGSLAVAYGMESLGMSHVLAKDIALLGFYLQIVSHGVFTAGFMSSRILSMGRNVKETSRLISLAVQTVREKSSK